MVFQRNLVKGIVLEPAFINVIYCFYRYLSLVAFIGGSNGKKPFKHQNFLIFPMQLKYTLIPIPF